MEYLSDIETKYDLMWEKISKLTKQITDVEASIDEYYKNKEKVTKNINSKINEDRKDVLHLKRQIIELEKKKQEIKSRLEIKMKKYHDQQSKILTRDWIIKSKKRLLKCQVKEAAEIKLDKERCERLIKDTQIILGKFSKLKKADINDTLIIPIYSGKEKKKKKKHKEEILIDALRLDALREEFEYFDISPPEDENELELATTQLNNKLQEIISRPLTEVIGIDDAEIDSISFANLSITTEQ